MDEETPAVLKTLEGMRIHTKEERAEPRMNADEHGFADSHPNRGRCSFSFRSLAGCKSLAPWRLLVFVARAS
jgi:hypothetical protein